MTFLSCRRSVSVVGWALISPVLAGTQALGADAGVGIPFKHEGLRPFDWAVLGVYAAVLLGIGFYFSRRQKTTEEYFLASRSTKPFMAGISLFASLVSTISYVAMPGEMVQNGPVLIGLYVISLPLIYVVAGWVLIPAVMRLQITSAYELLEEKLGLPVRLIGSVTFIVTRLVWMALMLYTMSTVLINVVGLDVRWRVPLSLIAGIIITTYTVFGGIRALIVTDVLQFFMLLAGAVLTIVWISVEMHGVSAWWPQHWMAHWAPQPVLSFDPHVRVTMVGTFVGTFIWWICATGSDQLTIQRYLTTRDVAAARRAFSLTNLADATVTILLGLVGLTLLGFYQQGALPKGLSFANNGDAFFPHFISHFLPVGISGLVVAGLLGATMSSLSSGLNSVITVFSKDIIETRRRKRERSEEGKILTARYLAAAFGMTAVAGSVVIGLVSGNLIEVANKTVNLFGCPMFGFFFLAMFVKFASPFGAILGAVCSFLAAVMVAYWDAITGRAGLSFQWIAPVSFVVSLACGCGFSLLLPRRKPSSVLAAYLVAILALLAVLIYWVRV
ncbi:MAG: sglT 1 [Verrucomicrobia bacterium]|nr:sglT 1 [Verrucomicrobiota bacterium]